MQEFLKANYHTHTTRCKHAYGSEREYIEAAIAVGIKTLGFSDHIPCPYKNGFVSGIRMDMGAASEYVSTLRRLGEEYKNDIKIYVGFEAEYIPKFYREQMDLCDSLAIDYLIMGQHFLGSEDVGPYTGTPTDDESRVRDYVDTVLEGMNTGSYCCLAHPDILNYQGLDSIYEWEMTRLCRELKKMKIPLELNLLGISQNKQYPAERFWKIVSEIGNEVILGLDAHCVEHLMDVESYQKGKKMAEKYHLNIIDELKIKN